MIKTNNSGDDQTKNNQGDDNASKKQDDLYFVYTFDDNKGSQSVDEGKDKPLRHL